LVWATLTVVLLAGCSGGGGGEGGAGGAGHALTQSEARQAAVDASSALAADVQDPQHGTMSSFSAVYSDSDQGGTIEVLQEFASDGARHAKMTLSLAGSDSTLEAWCTADRFVVRMGTALFEGRPTSEDCLEHVGMDPQVLAAIVPSGAEVPSDVEAKKDGSVAATYTGDGATTPDRTVQVDPEGRVSVLEMDAGAASARMTFAHDAKRAPFELPLSGSMHKLPAKVVSSTSEGEDVNGYGEVNILVQRSPDRPKLSELQFRTTDHEGKPLAFTDDECDGSVEKNGISCFVEDRDDNGRLTAGDVVSFATTYDAGLLPPGRSSIYDTWAQDEVTPDPMGGIAGALAFGEFVPGLEAGLAVLGLLGAAFVRRLR
jgi:hypothetical protein